MKLIRSRFNGFLSKYTLLGILAVGSSLCMPHVASAAGDVEVSLVEAIDTALRNNEDIKESFSKVASSEAMVTMAEGAYDLTLYNEFRYGRYQGLEQDDYLITELTNFATDYMRNDLGISQRIATGATLKMYYTHIRENRLNLVASLPAYEIQNYFTVELAQSLLKGVGDKANQGAIKDALLSVQDSKEERSIVVSQVALSVIQSYWSLAIARNNYEVSEKILKMAQEVYRRELVRFDEGLSQGVDVQRARMAVDQRKFILNQYQRDISVAEEQLQFLMNSPTIADSDTIIPVSPLLVDVRAIPDQIESEESALMQRNELRQLGIMLDKLNIEHDVKTNNLMPQLDIVLGYTTSQGNDYLRGAESFKGTPSEDSWYAGVTFSYPLQNRAAKGSLLQTEKLMLIAKDRVNKTRRSIVTEVENVIHNLYMAKNGIPIAKQALEAAKRVVSGERTRFEMGGINNRDLLASHDSLGREEMSYFIALAQYNMALAEYNYAVGDLLETYKISISDEEAKML